jgi:signal transduction histidine kinase
LLNYGMMESAVRPGTRASQQRARFEAVRRRVFDELETGSARWRLTWILPFQVFIVGLLVIRGESHTRAVLQIVMLGVCAVHFVMRTRPSGSSFKALSFLFGIASYFVLVGTTGGLASPLLVMGTMMLASAAFTTLEPRWIRGAVFLGFLVGVTTLAVLSRVGIGQLEAPLVGPEGLTAEYATLSLLAIVFVMMGVYRMGCTMTRGYERTALELAERREELCTEGEDRSRALEGLAARMAHEVKNPLAAIKGLSQHMARQATDPKTAERLAIVAAEAERLQGIVEGFLSFSRGLDDLNLGPTRPHEVAHELSVLLETRAEEAGVLLEVSGDAKLVLDADARKLRQALLNLVVNAIQASPREGTVKLSVAGECAGARITVHDDGVGMTPEVLDRIRKPYFTTKEGGTGLGVAVARGIVEQHGGHMDIKSASGKGTTVTITLPMKAKTCLKLPNPAYRPSPGERSTDPDAKTEQKPEPAPAVAR